LGGGGEAGFDNILPALSTPKIYKKGAVNMYTLVGTKDLDFMGSDGKQVNGVNLFFTYEDERVRGVATERVFVHSDRFLKLSFMPEIGGSCDLRYDKYGKIRDIVPA
jgi:hypothetical protein